MMLRSATLGSFVLATLLCTTDGTAQRFRGRPRPDAQPTPAPTEAPKPAEKKPIASWTAIRGGDVHVGDGKILRRATVLIGDDQIQAVGNDVEIPEGATILDATGKVVAPGFCIVRATGIAASSGSDDVRENLNPFDPTIKMALAAGITSFLWQSGGGSATPGGNSALVKLAFGDLAGMVEVENQVTTMRVPLAPRDLVAFRDLVKQARDHRDAVRATEGQPNAKPPQAPRGTEDILKVMAGDKRLWITSGGGMRGGGFGIAEIRQAMEIASLLGVGVVLDKPIEAWLIPDELAATGSMAIVSPRQRVEADPGSPDDTGSNVAQAAILGEAGVPVAVTTPVGGYGGSPSIGTGGILGQDLNTPHIDAAFAVRGGMDNRLALRTLTLDAARICNAERRVGSLEPGKDADVLILDGDPLNYKTFVEIALVNGKVVYRKDDEPYYRHIKH